MTLCGYATYGAQLPVPCLPGTCSSYNKANGTATPVPGFVTAGQASAASSGNTLAVTQSSNQAILNWSSFNIGAGGKVIFQQPSATSIALNKIYQASPSSVFGQLSANGQIYLINPNGFVFGNTSRVNVAGLVASSLGLFNGDAELAAGILSPIAQTTPAPAFASDGRLYVTDSAGSLVLDEHGDPQPVQVVVQPGAQISAADGGRLLVAGQSVVNGGSLSAPDGQIVLAAGQSVYLQASADPSLRGLVVEVTGNGTASNQIGATLSAPRGNVSLIGLAVNQDGRISATTAVSANGSVILQAADGSGQSSGCNNGQALCATQGGTLSVGASSDIDVLPEYADSTTAVVAQQQLQSRIQLTGQQVNIEGGQINAPGGTLSVFAAADPNPALGLSNAANTAAQIRIASGTDINLAGSDAQLPMAANLLAIQLRSNELEDDPDQRTTVLHGQTVIADMRAGRPPIISDSSWQSAVNGVQENVAQRTAAGGSASFLSEGDIVFNSGAKVDVSGGQWSYAPGVLQTSQLIGANGRAYDIDSASPSLTYTSVLNPTYTQTYAGWGVQITEPTPGLAHYESGYVQGFSAGQVQFAAPTMVLGGQLVGTAVNGLYQRSATTIPAESLAGIVATLNGSASAMASGATLLIGDPASTVASGGSPEYFSPPVNFASQAPAVSITAGAPLTPQTLQLPVAYLTNGGFAHTEIYGDSSVTLPVGLALNLGAGGSLQIVAPRIAIDSNIQAPGGSIDLQSVQTADNAVAGAGAARLGIDIADGVALDVRGQWTNNSPYGSPAEVAPTFQDGGTIELSLNGSPYTSGAQLVLGNDVTLQASGGAWIQANSSVVGGKGGSISIDASPYQSALQVGNAVGLDAFGVDGATGGTFALAAPRIAIGQFDGDWAASQRIDALVDPGAALDIGAALFSNYGFSSVRLIATAPSTPGLTESDVLTVLAGTAISGQSQTLQLLSGYTNRASGGDVLGFATPQAPPEADRKPYSISLQVVPATTATIPSGTVAMGDLDIQAGASIVTDANKNSSIDLIAEGSGSIVVDGALRAPGGTITAQISAPVSLTDPGYLPNQRIELGTQALLDVSGRTLLTPNSAGLALGTVLPGGSISLLADRGEVITAAGSSIDIAGASSALDVQAIGGLGGYRTATIGSAGGSVLVQSIESVSLLGSLSAAAGNSSAGSVEGGSLEVDLSNVFFSHSTTPVNPYPTAPLTIEVVSNSGGSSASAPYSGLAVLGIAQLEQSGIDVLKLRADDVIALTSGSPLTLPREISLDTPVIAVSNGISAQLNAPYVVLTDSNNAVTAAGSAVPGSGSLSVNAQQIVLSGFTALHGVADATLTSTGDVALQPLDGTDLLTGGLALAGNLTIDAARVYPATNESYSIGDSDGAGTVTIGQTAASPGTPLSVGGALNINAANIVNAGTLLAPFGSIALNASRSLSLLDGSVTSVSADGSLLPYGQTALGQQEWIYQAGHTSFAVNGIPSRAVSLSAPKVSFASGAIIDVSGGGDLFAYEWVPGTGGSVDALGQANASSANLYAVLPSTRGQYAAYDLQEFTDSSVSAGESVYLSGSSGLPAGTYPLLPARYSLLPGAYLIQLEPGYQSLTPGSLGALADGTPVVAGYLSFGNTGLQSSSGYTGFALRPGTYTAAVPYSQPLAQYQTSTASSYFAAAAASAGHAQVTLPADAGTLLIAAGNSLNALGKVDSSAAPGGSAATIELSATDLTITAASQAGGGTGVSIGAPVIQSWNAGDLILGGQLSSSGISVTANSVTIGPDAQFSAGQILAVADQSIDVQAGATVASTSGANDTSLKTLPGSMNLDLAPGVALLAVSDTALPIAARSAATGGGTVTGGTIGIERGATLKTRGAVALDAPAGVSVAGTIDAPGASWSLASDSIAFVGGAASSSDTLQINLALLSQLQTAGAAQLASAGAIDLLVPVTLGASAASSAPTLSSLSLTAASINNLVNGASVFGGQTLSLQGVGDNALTPTTGTGTLTLVANTLNLGAGNLAINGDAQNNLHVTGAVAGQGTGAVQFAGNVSISAAELTAASQSATTIMVPAGNLHIVQNGSAVAPSSLSTSLGGDLTLMATQIEDAGSIIVPGGRITLKASSDIGLTSGAVVNAGGIMVGAGDQAVGAAGGIVTIAAGGNLSAASGASVNVAGAGNAPAGWLTLTGTGTVSLDARLAGGAAAGAIGGNFSLDAGVLDDGLEALTSTLMAGGFSNQVAVRVRSGDLASAAGSTLTANQITLTADQGSIDIAGTLSAPAAGQRGSIGLFAGNDVVLESTAALHADASGAQGRGGDIELSSANGSISLDGGSVISAAGLAQMGSLLLRAPALVAQGDVAINAGSNLAGANLSALGQVTIEPVLPTYSSIGDFTANFGQIQTDVTSYLTRAQPVITARLQPTAGPVAVVQPGVVVQTDGDLMLSQALDLYALQLGAPIDLTVRASGSITIAGTISDGIDASSNTLSANVPSSSMRFVAGADLSSANPLATVAGSGADLTLGMANSLNGNALLRTGTGEIDMVAAHDVVFATNSSAYTTGYAALAAANVKTDDGTSQDNYPTQGGNILVTAGNSVQGQPVQVSVSDWQLRQAKGGLAGWGVNLDAFDATPWDLATFGGGDLRIAAGLDVVNVSAAVADSMAVSGAVQTHFASGGLTVEAGRDITSGQYSVADGIGTLTAGRSFAANLTSGTVTTPVGSLFALQDSQVALWAEDGIAIGAIVNPTVLAQPLVSNHIVDFFSYGSQSALSAQSSSGDVTLLSDSSNSSRISLLLGTTVAQDNECSNYCWTVLPASLALRSLTRDVVLQGGNFATQYPSDTGQLQLFAGRDIVGYSPATGSGFAINMSDAADSELPTVAAPAAGSINAVLETFSSDRHALDTTPASIIAGRDIDNLTVSNPKAGVVSAGRNIIDLTYDGQNLNPTDLTLISAGNSFADPLSFAANGVASTAGRVSVGGPGRLEILAGGTINLGFSQGVTTDGNLINPNLSTAAGADITMIAGLGRSPDYADFYQQIIRPSASYQQQLLAYVESISGQTGLSVARADSEFSGYSPDLQRPLIDQVFFNELNLSGLEANQTPGLGYSRGYAAITSLFPGSPVGSAAASANPYAGDLNLTYSQIYTLSGGNISLLVPGGAINVGLASPPTSVISRSPSELGIVAQRAGDVNIYSLGDVNVNASRIFTLGGGNILIWSEQGSIDAGNGAKSSLSLPPPTLAVDANGNVFLDYNAAVAGSGIRTIQTSSAVPAGNVDLIAPVGAVNAGDAGIGAAGNINIAALTVTGASNINFGGSATGVPAVVSNISASLSGASNAAGSVANSATTGSEEAGGNREASAPLAQAAISWLEVFVTGLGEEDCRPDDMECLRRQKHP
jgi:filamentous hemagglutinin family protein